MSKEQFNDNCPGCRPIIIDTDTMKALPSDSWQMQAVDRVWAETTWWERKDFHDFTCLNSREPQVLVTVNGLCHRINYALKAAEPKTSKISEASQPSPSLPAAEGPTPGR
jgi:hypothetical protein